MMYLRGFGKLPVTKPGDIVSTPPAIPPSNRSSMLIAKPVNVTSAALQGLFGLDPGVSTGIAVLAVLGLGALGVAHVLKRRR